MVIDFSTFYNFPNMMDKVMEEVWSPSFAQRRRMVPYPPLNLSEDTSAIYVRAEVPGVEMEDLEVTLTGKSLIIKGERKAEEGRYYRQERPAGAFQRIAALNVPVDRDAVKASLAEGVLTVVLPKSEAEKPKKIAIDVG